MASNNVKVPFVNLAVQYDQLRDEVLEVFDSIGKSGFYVLGPNVNKFEEEFARFCGVKHAVSCGNGTDALWLVLQALGVGPGDEVITASNSFIASAGAIAHVGAKPIFADVAEDYNIDVKDIEKRITSKTKAIMPVHFTGRSCRMDEIMALARENNLFVVEDAAQAVGATYRGTKVGAWGDAGGFSLHPLKNLHLYGDGGIITTNSDEVALKAKQLRNHGLRDRDHCDFFGSNSRLDEMQAAFGLIKLKYIDKWNLRFQEIANMYQQGLDGFVSLPEGNDENFQSVFHNFVIQVNKRAELMKFLEERGVQTKIHYPVPIHKQKAYEVYNENTDHLVKTMEQSQSIMSLPIYPELINEQVTYVIESIREFCREAL